MGNTLVKVLRLFPLGSIRWDTSGRRRSPLPIPKEREEKVEKHLLQRRPIKPPNKKLHRTNILLPQKSLILLTLSKAAVKHRPEEVGTVAYQGLVYAVLLA